jgi:uncharacterized protein (DUF4415 family)
MPKLKPGTIVPTPAEDAVIQAGIDADPAAYSMTDEEWTGVKPAAKMGRPKAETTKERITIRLSGEVLERFRASGNGWQTRVDAALKDWLRDHSPIDTH